MNDVVACLVFPTELNSLDRASLGLIGEGKRLADSLGTKLRVVVLSTSSESDYNSEAALSALSTACEPFEPKVILLSNDCYSQELAPRLAHRLGGSAVGDGVGVQIENDRVRVRRGAYGGKAMAVVELKKSPGVVWLRARSFAAGDLSTDASEVVTVALDSTSSAGSNFPRLIERKSEKLGEVRLEDAEVIVSGGRGLGGPEPFEQLKEVASLIDAQVAASRAACDAGWVPPSYQVGQTGRKVSPALYLAVAISGASQHLAGISDAKVIAAINSDKDAPIFKHCSFGIVEDYRKVLPILKQQLASRRK